MNNGLKISHIWKKFTTNMFKSWIQISSKLAYIVIPEQKKKPNCVL